MSRTIDDEINSLSAFCEVIDAVGRLKRTLHTLSDAPSSGRLENEFFFYDILDESWKYDDRAWVEVMLTDDIDLAMTSHEMRDVLGRFRVVGRRDPKPKLGCTDCNI